MYFTSIIYVKSNTYIYILTLSLQINVVSSEKIYSRTDDDDDNNDHDDDDDDNNDCDDGDDDADDDDNNNDHNNDDEETFSLTLASSWRQQKLKAFCVRTITPTMKEPNKT